MMSDDTILKIYSLVIPAAVVLIGVLQMIFPEYAWWIEHGMPKDVEPSDAGMLYTRIGGIVLAVIGVILFFAAFSERVIFMAAAIASAS